MTIIPSSIVAEPSETLSGTSDCTKAMAISAMAIAKAAIGSKTFNRRTVRVCFAALRKAWSIDARSVASETVMPCRFGVHCGRALEAPRLLCFAVENKLTI